MHEASITLLNNAVGEEITALQQYMYFHVHCDDMGYDLLAGLFKKVAIEEMLHVERLAERILFLNGDVIMKASADVQAVRDVEQMVMLARKMELESATHYNLWANECAANADSASKKIFEDLVVKEEDHYDQFDVELDNMKKFGDNYLALQSIDRSRTKAAQAPTGV